MLFILRQLRRLELRQRSGRYFVYAIGEIVLIVVGILIALQIQNWNQKRLDRIEERYLLEELVDNLNQEAERLKSGGIERQSQQLEGLNRIAEYFDSGTISEETFREDLEFLNGYYAYNPFTSAYETMKSGGFGLSDRELKQAILYYYQQEVRILEREVQTNHNFSTNQFAPIHFQFFYGGPNRDIDTPKDIDDPAFKEAVLHILGPKLRRVTRSLERSETLLEKNRELHALVEQELEEL